MSDKTLEQAWDEAGEKAKNADFYPDLTDEEREEEGLPPRPGAEKEEAAPADEKPEVKEPEKEPEAEEEEEADETSVDKLLSEIQSLREDILKKDQAAPPETKSEEDQFLEAALEHDDPVMRGMAERLRDTEQRLKDVLDERTAEREAAQQVKDASDFKAVKATYEIEGKNLTDEHVFQVMRFGVENPELAGRLTIEQLTRVVFPDAVKVRAKSSPANGPDGSRNGRVATIIDEGSSGGAPTPAQKWQPKPGDDMGAAIKAAGRQFGWVR